MKIAKFDSDSDDDRNVQEDNYAVVQAELITAFRARKHEPLGSDPLLSGKQHWASHPDIALQTIN